jgi:hypothetical protein
VVAEHSKRFSVTTTGKTRTLHARFTPQEAERPLRFLRWVLARLEAAVRP